jgi:hypothetical protein
VSALVRCSCNSYTWSCRLQDMGSHLPRPAPMTTISTWLLRCQSLTLGPHHQGLSLVYRITDMRRYTRWSFFIMITLGSFQVTP